MAFGHVRDRRSTHSDPGLLLRPGDCGGCQTNPNSWSRSDRGFPRRVQNRGIVHLFGQSEEQMLDFWTFRRVGT